MCKLPIKRVHRKPEDIVMDIGKINSAIQQAGYNPFAVSGTGEEDAMKLAQKNGISVEEAQEILKEAEKQAEENDKMAAQQSAMLEVLNTQDEEELVVLDDADFDNFLNNKDAENQMHDMLNQQQFVQPNNQSEGLNNSANNQNLFAQDDNPFTKMRF